MGHQDALPREEMVDFVMSCWDEEAGEHGQNNLSNTILIVRMSWMKVLLDLIQTMMLIFLRL